MKSLNLVPDIWLRVGVKRHAGLLSSRRRSYKKEDDEVFDCSYILLYLAMGGPGIQLVALRKDGGQ